MSRTTKMDLDDGTSRLWPVLTAGAKLSEASPSLDDVGIRSLVEQLVDNRLAEAHAERQELKKETRWMGVRVLTLEQTLKKSQEESKALAEYLQLCFDEIRSQEDRLSPRLASLESEAIALSSRVSQTSMDSVELRKDTSEALTKIDALAAELFELIYDAKLLAVQASGNADAAALQANELTANVREANEHVALLEGRTNTISTELEGTVEAAEIIITGLTEAAQVSASARAVAEEARRHAEGAAGLSEELRNDLELRTKALREEITNLATLEDIAALEEADRRLEETAKNAVELAEEVRVLAEKAKDRADYAADTSDEVRADLDDHGDALASLKKRSKALRNDLDKRTNALRNDLQKRTDALRTELDNHDGSVRTDLSEQAEQLREYIEEQTAVLEEQAAAIRAEIGERDGGLRTDLDERAEQLRVDLDERAAAIRAEFGDRDGGLRTDMDERTKELRADLEEQSAAFAEQAEKLRLEIDEQAEALRADLDLRTEQLLADLDERTSNLQVASDSGNFDDAALRELRDEVTSSLAALKERVDERLITYADDEDKPRKRWHAHLRRASEEVVEEQKALPSET